MKTLIKLTILSFLILNDQIITASSIVVSDAITENTVWDIDTVKVKCNIVVDTNATLAIKPGTVVEFQGSYKLDVKGRLLAEGTQSDYVIFTSSDTAGYHNKSHTGWGGIKFYDIPDANDTSKLIYCIIEYAKNTQTVECGGAVGIENFSKLVISNCLIRYNYASSRGIIGIRSYAQPLVKNNYIQFNTITINNYNGAIYLMGNAKIQNNVISNNNAKSGIYIESGKPTIINNTISKNNAGILIDYLACPVIKNSIIWDNASYQIEVPQYLRTSTRSIIENCNIQGYFDGIFSSYVVKYKDNINLEPYFTDIENNDYSLTDSSYCINAGTPDTAGLNIGPCDIAGNPRIYQGFNTRIDIGAYEFQGITNIKPILKKTSDQYALISISKVMTIDFIADGSVSINILSDNNNVTAANLSGDTTGSKYQLIPAKGWSGMANIMVEIEDFSGDTDCDTFKLYVSEYFCGNINKDELWDFDTVKIICDIVIEDGATLTINPGTVVEFQGPYKLDVEGQLLAVGRPSGYITFTTFDTTGYHNNTHTGWKGIVFYYTPDDNDTSKLIYCRIEYARNTQSFPNYYGGAIGIKNLSKLVVSDCIIRFNYAYYGGGIAIYNAQPVISNNYILCNSASRGAGIWTNCDVKLKNNVISNNNGEGIYIGGASPEIINNTICNNREGIASRFSSNAVIKNSILWGNTSQLIFWEEYDNYAEIEYCDIEGGLEGITCSYCVSVYENNIDAEPYFTDLESMDYSLSDSSYCINTGTPDTTGLRLPAVDIAGNPRIHSGINTRIDIGAYEFQGTPDKKPILKKTEDQYTLISRPMGMTIYYIDDDACCIDIYSDNPNVAVDNLTGDTTGSKYDLIPATGWKGSANIAVTIRDVCGNTSSDTFKLFVSKCLCDDIIENELWDLDTVKILCDIKVENGATLSIAPGTIVEFQEYYKFDIQGRLLAEGKSAEPITFTVSDTSGYYSYTNIGWGGIRYESTPQTNDTSRIIFCNIQYSKNRALYISDYNKLIVSDCNIRYNLPGGISLTSSSIIIRNNRIYGNRFYGKGGGISVNSSSNPIIMNNVIYDNDCGTYSYTYGGGISVESSSYPIIINNLIYDNVAGVGGGGGLYVKSASFSLFNNTIYNNQSYTGGGIYIADLQDSSVIKNTIIRGNTATTSGQQLYLGSASNILELYYNNIEGVNKPFGERDFYILINNIDALPGFADEDNNDYQLDDSSACINAGDPLTDITAFPFDIAGNPRITEGIIDIGAYEYPVCLPPTNIMLSNSEIAENVPSGSVVGILSTAVGSIADFYNYSFDTGDGINDIDSGYFIISADTLKIKVTPDFEEKDTFRIYLRTTKNGIDSLSYSRAFAVVIADVNERPIIEPQFFNIDENSQAGTILGTVTASDVDNGQTLTFSIISGNTDSAFMVNLFTGEIAVNNSDALDIETTPLFGLTISAQDNGHDSLANEALITITINDINERPVIEPQSFSIDENSQTGTILGTVTASDVDNGQTLTYSIISGNTDNAFTVDPFTGLIAVDNSDALDYETTPVFELTMQIEDDGPGNLKDEAFIIIDINNIDEPVSIIDFDSDILKIFPNPAKGSVYLEFSDENPGELLIELRSVNGTIYYQSEIELSNTDSIIELELSDIPEGLYILNLKSKTISLTRKIEIIQVR